MVIVVKGMQRFSSLSNLDRLFRYVYGATFEPIICIAFFFPNDGLIFYSVLSRMWSSLEGNQVKITN
jgi:hypothetical protein